jgi:hypothetical protein
MAQKNRNSKGRCATQAEKGRFCVIDQMHKPEMRFQPKTDDGIGRRIERSVERDQNRSISLVEAPDRLSSRFLSAVQTACGVFTFLVILVSLALSGLNRFHSA